MCRYSKPRPDLAPCCQPARPSRRARLASVYWRARSIAPTRPRGWSIVLPSDKVLPSVSPSRAEAELEPESIPLLETRQLAGQLYAELRAIAHRLQHSERDDHTLQTTGLVHEAFLRLADQHATQWENRAHFLSAAARTMRQVLVDYARERAALKRDGGQRTTLVSVPDDLHRGEDRLDVIALDHVLSRLAELDPRQAHVVELRVFGGFEISEVAEIIHVSVATVNRDWRFAKTWLARELTAAD
ncbi:MAG: ECF-type sigma factor [Gemmatimonadota bacterium]|nr:ECF-type sigma factor [Gemmatimonadota bacterium]